MGKRAVVVGGTLGIGREVVRIPDMFAGIPICERIAKACEVAAFSKEKYDIYQADMRSERDIAYFNNVCFDEGFGQGRDKGRQEGREEGQKQEKIDLAKKMKESGMPIQQIAGITGLSESDISML